MNGFLLKLLFASACAFAAFVTGVHWGTQLTEGRYAQAALEDTQEAVRIESARAARQQEKVNGYIKQRNASLAGERAAATDLQRVRDELAHAAEQHAGDARVACGDLQRRYDVVIGLLGEGAGLVEEGGRRVAELASRAEALRPAGKAVEGN